MYYLIAKPYMVIVMAIVYCTIILWCSEAPSVMHFSAFIVAAARVLNRLTGCTEVFACLTPSIVVKFLTKNLGPEVTPHITLI